SRRGRRLLRGRAQQVSPVAHLSDVRSPPHVGRAQGGRRGRLPRAGRRTRPAPLLVRSLSVATGGVSLRTPQRSSWGSRRYASQHATVAPSTSGKRNMLSRIQVRDASTIDGESTSTSSASTSATNGTK